MIPDSFVRPDFWLQTWIFISLTVRGLGLGLLISIPLGILLSRLPRIAGPIIYVLALVQTIPSLALLGFFISLLHLVGTGAAVTAAVVYSVFPIVMNTYTGITQVDPRIRDAARGMGMTSWQILWRVELPLALPVIAAGIQTGAIYAIGVITICAIAGTGGLGEYIVRGVTMGDVPLILVGVVPILLLTWLAFWGMAGLARLTRQRASLGLLLGGVLVLVMAGYAAGDFLVQTVRSLQTVHEAASSSAAEVAPPYRERTWAEVWDTGPQVGWQTVQFLSLAARGLGVTLLLGFPLGVLLTRLPRLAKPLLSVLAMLQTVPTLALLGFCVGLPLLIQDMLLQGPGTSVNLSFLGLFGGSAVVFATVVYTLFPIVLNTYTGITQVDPRIRDAARGMGMTGRQLLWRVELPLAVPVILDGVRTAAIYAIALVTIGSVLTGSRGLGEFIVLGMQQNDDVLVLLGVLPIFLLSLAVFWGLSGLAWLRRLYPSFGQATAVVLILVLSGYAVAEPFFRHRSAVRLGTKNFTESLILGQMLRLLLEAHTDLEVEFFPNLGSNYAFKSLRAGQLDIYPEYTGTILAYKDALNQKAATAVAEARKQGWSTPGMTRDDLITLYVREEVKKRFDLVLLETFGMDNTYAVLTPAAKARDHDLHTIGDLKKMPQFRVVVDQEFKERPDGWKGLAKTYDLKFTTEPRQFDPTLIYRSLEAGDADVVIGFATDWQIQQYNLTMLKDDKQYFPSYQGAPLARRDVLDRHPEIAKVLNRLAGRINEKTARELSRQVVVERRWAEDVAREFLEKEGLLPMR
jgi:osmoprotectant transport system permease protein